LSFQITYLKHKDTNHDPRGVTSIVQLQKDFITIIHFGKDGVANNYQIPVRLPRAHLSYAKQPTIFPCPLIKGLKQINPTPISK